MAQFGSHEAWARYYLAEGFRVGQAQCSVCSHQWNAVIRPETIDTRLECPACHQQRNFFLDYQVATDH